MTYWEEIDENGEAIRTIVMDKETMVEDFEWIQKNLGGQWKLKKIVLESE